MIKVPEDVRICVVGDIHEHPEQFFKLIDIYKPSQKYWIVSVGDVYDKGFGRDAAEKITDSFIELQNEGIGFAVRGNHELKAIRNNKKKGGFTKHLKWWKEQPLVLTFEFQRGKRLCVLHAGVTPKMWPDHLGNDVEVCYVRDIDDEGKMIPLVWKDINGERCLVKAREGGRSWHEIYDGRFGYIASGHVSQKDGFPKFYNNSCNLDTGVYETGILTAQVFLPNGNLGEKIQTKGEARKPDLPGDFSSK
jgi:predicted phosphodiesterase